MSEQYKCRFCLRFISIKRRREHHEEHVAEGLLLPHPRVQGLFVSTQKGMETLKQNEPQLSKRENRGRRDPYGREEGYFTRHRKWVCVKCLRVNAGYSCCKEFKVELPLLAQVPRKHASRYRWRILLSRYPNLLEDFVRLESSLKIS